MELEAVKKNMIQISLLTIGYFLTNPWRYKHISMEILFDGVGTSAPSCAGCMN